ncbi:hypothetical protein KJY77_02695 [Canibacter sp. lx-72]|uniref:lipopolysaccharide biosynthesis protein n=1 Tax=Canibacter zhuwentaonis TaxID=2837491 RepID=UPI001BDC0122|nr:hypothetical protein [Canibacter zhuwentaonis]MBT1018051.1 hypothetical protein [Canibacter zhuwentaonis]
MPKLNSTPAAATSTTAAVQTGITGPISIVSGQSSRKAVQQVTAHLFGASIVRNLGQLGVMLLLTRTLTAHDFGQYTLALAIVTPIFVLSQLNLRTVFLTVIPVQPLSSHLAAQHLAVVVATAVAGVIVGIVVPEILPIVLIMAIVKASDAYIDLLSAAWQSVSRTSRIFWGSMFVGAGSLLAATAIMLITNSIIPTLLALAVSSAIIVAVIFAFPVKYLRGRELAARRIFAVTKLSAKKSILKVLRAGLPLGTATAVLSAVSFAPQYFLSPLAGAAAAGHFAVLIYMYAIADLTMGNIAQAWIPRGQASYGKKNVFRWILSPTLKWTLVFIPLALLGVTAGHWLYPQLFGEAYAFGTTIAIPLVTAIVLLPFAHFTGAALSIANRYTTMLSVNTLAAITALIACATLIPAHGVGGGFWAVAVAVLVRGTAVLGFLSAHSIKHNRKICTVK